MVNTNFFHFNKPAFIIAEVGINHNGSLDEAICLVEAAKNAGADAVKFQTYKTELRTKKNSPIYEILKKCELSNDDFLKINQRCKDINIEFFSTPFDYDSFQVLESIGVGIYKVASFDITNKPLLEIIANSGKSVIFSTGMASENEIDQAFNIFKDKSANIAILHCISGYPTPETSCRLSNIRSLIYKYPNTIIGYSDHSNGIDVPLYAVACGAKVIEKHFMLTDNHECIDNAVSVGENQFFKMVKNIRNLELIIGNSEFGVRPEEKEIVQYRRTSI